MIEDAGSNQESLSIVNDPKDKNGLSGRIRALQATEAGSLRQHSLLSLLLSLSKSCQLRSKSLL